MSSPPHGLLGTLGAPSHLSFSALLASLPSFLCPGHYLPGPLPSRFSEQRCWIGGVRPHLGCASVGTPLTCSQVRMEKGPLGKLRLTYCFAAGELKPREAHACPGVTQRECSCLFFLSPSVCGIKWIQSCLRALGGSRRMSSGRLVGSQQEDRRHDTTNLPHGHCPVPPLALPTGGHMAPGLHGHLGAEGAS